MKRQEKILVCYNKPNFAYTDYSGKGISGEKNNFNSETEILDNLKNIVDVLSSEFKEVNTLEFESDIQKNIERLNNFSPDVCLNFVESHEGNSSYESYVAGFFELTHFAYTGNTLVCLATCLDKEIAKSILKSKGISTPDYALIEPNANFSTFTHDLNYPVILKLNGEDAGIGINEHSVVNNIEEFNKQAKMLMDIFNKTVIAEEYIEGREFNISILGNRVLPVAEISFDTLPNNLPKIVTYEAKWDEQSDYYKGTIPVCPAQITKEQEQMLSEIALKSFNVLKCRDYARVDIRLNKNNIPFVLEVNPNPDIMKDSGFANSAKAAGISYSKLLTEIINLALTRKNP